MTVMVLSNSSTAEESIYSSVRASQSPGQMEESPHSPRKRSVVSKTMTYTTNTVTETSDTNSIDLSKYRLPNLLENKLRRLAMREQKIRNPNTPSTRILYANFSTPQKRMPKKELAKSDLKDEKSKRTRKKKRGVGRVNPSATSQGRSNHSSVGSRRLPSHQNRIGSKPPSTHFSSMLSVDSSVTDKEGIHTGISSASKPTNTSSTTIRSSEDGHGTVPGSARPNRPLPSDTSSITLFQAKKSKSITLRKKIVAPIDTYLATTSYGTPIPNFYSLPVACHQEEPIESTRAILGRRARSRKRDRGPKPILPHPHPETISKRKEVDSILQAFERYDMPIERKVVEQAILHPENTFLPLIQTTKTEEGKNENDPLISPRTPSDSSSTGGTNPPSRLTTPGTLLATDLSSSSATSRRRHRRHAKAGLNMATLLVKPYQLMEVKDDDAPVEVEMKVGSRIHSWWTADEFKNIKKNIREYRHTQQIQKEQDRQMASKEYKPQVVRHADTKDIALRTSKFLPGSIKDQKLPQFLPNQDEEFVSQTVDAMARLSLVLPRAGGRITPIRPHSALSRPSVLFADDNYVNSIAGNDEFAVTQGSAKRRQGRQRAISESIPQNRQHQSLKSFGVDYIPSSTALSRVTADSRSTTMSIFSDINFMLHSRPSSSRSTTHPATNTAPVPPTSVTGPYLQTSYGRPRYSVL